MRGYQIMLALVIAWAMLMFGWVLVRDVCAGQCPGMAPFCAEGTVPVCQCLHDFCWWSCQ